MGIVAFFAVAALLLPESGTIPASGLLIKGPPKLSVTCYVTRPDGSQFETDLEEQHAGYLFALPRGTGGVYSVLFVDFTSGRPVRLGVRRYSVAS